MSGRNWIHRNWIRLSCVLGGVLLLISGAVLHSMFVASGASLANTAELPQTVDLFTDEGRIQIRDSTGIVTLQSILNGQEFEGEVSGEASFRIFIPPTDRSSFTYAPSPIHQVGDQFIWEREGRKTTLNGSLADFVWWLRIRRCNELRRRADSTHHTQGEATRDQILEEGSAALIRIAESENDDFAVAGIREIAAFLAVRPIAPTWIPGVPHPIPRWQVSDPDGAVHDALLRVASSQNGEAQIWAILCLQEIGDHATAEQLSLLLEQDPGGPSGETLLKALATLYGIPDTYQRPFVCGNSTTEQVRAGNLARIERQKKAAEELLTWKREHAEDSQEEFFDAVVVRWTATLVEIANTAEHSESYGIDRTPARKLTNLLGLGRAVVPALKRRQSATKDWQEHAVLEFCIAFLIGDCDRGLAGKLLAGDTNQKRIGCSIIAAAADTSFDRELLELLRMPSGQTNAQAYHASIAVRNLAAQALFRSKGVEALPNLRTAIQQGFSSPMLQQILRHFDTPEMQY